MRPAGRRFLLLLLLLIPLPAPAYQVVNGAIYDADGQPVQLRGVNWFGFETEQHVAHGLWARGWREMIDQMAALGFTAVRLPLCPATLHGAKPGYIDPAKNPDLVGLDSLQILDRVVSEFSRRGFHVLLDHHSPDCRTISELWYTDRYSEQDWIADLVFLARHYGHLPGVIGIDLKNEPHGAATWGDTSPATDWNHAAERAGAAVLAVAPHWLIFVQGVGDHLGGDCGGGPQRWWGGNLAPLACHPIDPRRIPPDRLVLSPHVYGPDVGWRDDFGQPDFPANLPAVWQRDFGFLDDRGLAWVLGEFGGWYGRWGHTRDRQWQDALVDWLRRHGHRGGFYWSWNPNSEHTGGILDFDWHSVRAEKMALLRRLWAGGPAARPLTEAARDQTVIPGERDKSPTPQAEN